MRHFYPALLGIAMAMMPAHADTTDLLEGAVTADDSYYYNPDSFYAFWQGQYADGTFPGGNARPYSIFGEVLSGWAVTYNGRKYDIGGSDENGFSVGLPVIVLDWPTYNEAHPFRDFSYSFPIDVTVEGRVTELSLGQLRKVDAGRAVSLASTTTFSSSGHPWNAISPFHGQSISDHGISGRYSTWQQNHRSSRSCRCSGP